MIRQAVPGLLMFVSLIVCGRNACAESPVHPRSAEEQTMRRVVQLTNEIRVQHGLTPLQVHAALTRSARWMARDMVRHNYLRHTDNLGREIDPRLPECGYLDYAEIGENIAGGQLTPEEVVAAWMRSPGHRANLLNPGFREIGVAHFTGNKTHFKHYWVQDFGTRADSYPIVINNGITQTNDPSVNLYVYGEGWAKQMRFSNDRIHWSDWESYQSRCDWTLDTGYGDRTVFAEVRGGGMVRRSQDSVRLLASHQNTLIASAMIVRASH
jgi:uncharacterized protein YkwD